MPHSRAYTGFLIKQQQRKVFRLRQRLSKLKLIAFRAHCASKVHQYKISRGIFCKFKPDIVKIEWNKQVTRANLIIAKARLVSLEVSDTLESITHL